MQAVNIICLGKLKEAYLKEACKEYEKRLSSFCRLNIIEIEPVCLSQTPSENEILSVLSAETKKIMQKLSPNSYIFSMCIEGNQFTSEAFSEKIQAVGNSEKNSISFIIGSSYGLSDEIKKHSDFRFSMSKMTFPHQLARVMLLEQIYRGFSILGNSKYHK